MNPVELFLLAIILTICFLFIGGLTNMILTHREKMKKLEYEAYNEYQLELDRRKREMEGKPITDEGSS